MKDTKSPSHVPISPAILYWGTPVVLIATTNEDGTANICPVSSAFWLLDRCVLGLAAESQTTINMQRTGQCVLNLPSDDMVAAVNALARTTGTKSVPTGKVKRGYYYEKDKLGAAGLTPQASQEVVPPRIQECPVQMEAVVVGQHETMKDIAERRGSILAVEVRILMTWIQDQLKLEGHVNRVDPDKWRPMIMSFQQLYGLRGERAGRSRLAEIDEELYRPPKPS